jgi:hypothetical protein
MSKCKKWTDQEVDFLKLNFKRLPYEEISLKLGRTISSIKMKKNTLNLKTGNQCPLQMGEKIGRLTVIKRTDKRASNGQAYFECRCDCGAIVEVIGTSVRAGNTVSCGCYRDENTSERFRLDIGECSLNNLENMCKNNAKKRRENGIPYELTTKQFRYLISQDCYWCGDSPKSYNVYYGSNGLRAKSGIEVPDEWAEKQWVLANGIDRLDSNLAYTIGNCVPCCFPCNEMKMDKSEKEFLERMNKILDFQKTKP